MIVRLHGDAHDVSMDLIPSYQAVVAETGIVPEQIYARCSSLAAFTFTRPKAQAPRPGQKPAKRKGKR